MLDHGFRRQTRFLVFDMRWSICLTLVSLLCTVPNQTACLAAEPPPSATITEAGDVIALDLDGKMFARLNENGKQLIAEYHRAYERLLTFYRNIRMEVSEKRFEQRDGIGAATGDRLPLTRERRYRYMAMPGGFHRLEEEDEDEVSSLPYSMPTLKIAIATPEETFFIERTPPTGSPLVTACDKDSEESAYWLSGYPFVSAPFGLGATPLDWVVFGNIGSIVEKVEVESIANEEIATIVVSGADAKSSATWRLQFLKNRSWALREATFEGSHAETPGESIIEKQRCDYGESRDGVPIVTRAVWKWSKRKGAPAVEAWFDRREFDYTAVIPGAPDVQLFNARALADSPHIHHPISRDRVAWNVGGVLLMLTGLLMWYRKHVAANRSSRPLLRD
jgi:hypothetical protein